LRFGEAFVGAFNAVRRRVLDLEVAVFFILILHAVAHHQHLSDHPKMLQEDTTLQSKLAALKGDILPSCSAHMKE
jgi:hypothetical protein